MEAFNEKQFEAEYQRFISELKKSLGGCTDNVSFNKETSVEQKESAQCSHKGNSVLDVRERESIRRRFDSTKVKTNQLNQPKTENVVVVEKDSNKKTFKSFIKGKRRMFIDRAIN